MTQQGNEPMTITVEIKSVYGNEMIYPACDKARQFAALIGTKTLTRDAINKIKALGYDIQVKAPTL
jgi:archaellum biogenesis ATPase FlaH